MKKFLLFLLISLFYSAFVYSQSDGILISENFPYNSGNLTGQGNAPAWASTGTGGDVVVTALTNNTGALVYPGYSSGTSYVTTSNGNTRDPYKGFIGSQTISTASATTFYISFVVNVANSSNTSNTALAYPTAALRTSTGGNLSYFYIADDGNGHLKFGISKNGGLGNGDYASANYAFNTTYLIVIRYDIVTGGTTNDKMYLWVDPSLVSEPGTASAVLSIATGTDGSTSGSVADLQILEDDFFGIDGTTAKLDAFKVSYATGYATNPTNSTVAWSDLSPAGAPLPVKFGNLDAVRQPDGIHLSWTSYSEENADHYNIERSADGLSFSTVGQVRAIGNSNSRIDYEWTDAAPLSANNYYRIKLLDIDGHVTYSSIIRVSIGDNPATVFSLYPNPVSGRQLTLQTNHLLKGNYSVEIFNGMGQVLNEWQITISDENSAQTLSLPAGIVPGAYTLLMSSGAARYNKTFIVQ